MIRNKIYHQIYPNPQKCIIIGEYNRRLCMIIGDYGKKYLKIYFYDNGIRKQRWKGNYELERIYFNG